MVDVHGDPVNADAQVPALVVEVIESPCFDETQAEAGGPQPGVLWDGALAQRPRVVAKWQA